MAGEKRPDHFIFCRNQINSVPVRHGALGIIYQRFYLFHPGAGELRGSIGVPGIEFRHTEFRIGDRGDRREYTGGVDYDVLRVPARAPAVGPLCGKIQAPQSVRIAAQVGRVCPAVQLAARDRRCVVFRRRLAKIIHIARDNVYHGRQGGALYCPHFSTYIK